jgi:hypothetical protein
MARVKRVCPAGEVFPVLNRAVARLTIFEKPGDDAAFKRVRSKRRLILPEVVLGNDSTNSILRGCLKGAI